MPTTRSSVARTSTRTVTVTREPATLTVPSTPTAAVLVRCRDGPLRVQLGAAVASYGDLLRADPRCVAGVIDGGGPRVDDARAIDHQPGTGDEQHGDDDNERGDGAAVVHSPPR